ncbi:MAG: ChaN family lipoprotein [Polaromonas sp.]
MTPTRAPFSIFPARPMGWLASALLLAVLAWAAGCAGRPEAPILEQPTDAAAANVSGLDALLPADVLLVGEQHDAAAHHLIEQQIIARLAARGLLAALAMEMADTGLSTATLRPSATEQQVRNALKWDEKGWPWSTYGPAVMTAVRAGVAVLGANLPRAQMQGSMADSKLDAQLPGPVLKAQQQAVRLGHCSLLPENQITPMTRIQIARDITMANTLTQALLPGKVVVLLTGSGHADLQLGVPRHLPSEVKAKAIRLRAGEATGTEQAGAFDAVWTTPALAPTDHCAVLQKQLTTKP